MIKRLGLFMLLSSATTSSALAGGFEGPGIGTRALAMGSAFVAVADDWSAGFWNPAGLAFHPGWEVGETLDLLDLRALDGNSLANPVLPLSMANVEQGDLFSQFGGEPTQFGITDTTIRTALPSLGARKRWDRWGFGLGLFAPLGFAFDIDDRTVPGTHASYHSEGYILMYNVSIARKLSDRWSLGGGVNFLDARIKRDAKKETPTYTYKTSVDGRGHAFQFVGGLQGKLSERLTLGMAYKSGSDVELEGAASTTDTRYPLTIPGFGTLQNEFSGVTSDVYNPTIYSAGLAWRPMTDLIVAADWHGTDWRPTRGNYRFDRPGLQLQSQNYDAQWRFTNRASVGGEYRHPLASGDRVIIHAGYLWDPWAVPESAVSVTNLVDVSRHFYSAGFGWSHGAWEPTIAFSYAHGSRTIGGVDYKQSDRLLSLGLRYRG